MIQLMMRNNDAREIFNILTQLNFDVLSGLIVHIGLSMAEVTMWLNGVNLDEYTLLKVEDYLIEIYEAVYGGEDDE